MKSAPNDGRGPRLGGGARGVIVSCRACTQTPARRQPWEVTTMLPMCVAAAWLAVRLLHPVRARVAWDVTKTSLPCGQSTPPPPSSPY